MDIQAGFAQALQQHFGVPAYALTPFNAARAMVNRLRSAILVAGDQDIEPMAYLA
jgi:hypothetical protein